ncbi:MAG: hypothetical protein M3Q09_03625 [Gemmatimonadota bacterium]|nr:hypothetical protein [Gemmatimonadota bacterium]
MNFDSFPGGAIVRRGMNDVASGVITDEALLVMVGAPRLRALGLDIPPETFVDPERALYERLSASGADSAHSRYNALIRLLVSFERSFRSGIR